MLIDDLPESPYVGVVGHALEHDSRRTVGKRAIYNVAVSGNPTDVCSRPVNILFTQIKNHLVRECGIYEITATGMQDAFGLTCRPGCVENKERVFRIHHRDGAGFRLVCHHLVVPSIPRRTHWDWRAGAAHDQDMFNAFRTLDSQRHIDVSLSWYVLAPAKSF